MTNNTNTTTSSNNNNQWKQAALVLHKQGVSWRKIAKLLGVPKSSCSDWLRSQVKGYVRPSEIDGIVNTLLEPEDKKTSDLKQSESSKVKKKVKPKARTKNRHFIIGDTQAKSDVCLKYHTAIGQYIADKQPEVVIHIGDAADLPSLSSYDKGKRSFEGRRLVKDLDAVKLAFDMLMKPIYDLQEQQKKDGVEVYNPRLVITLGNHEQRLYRMMDDQPEFDGILGDDPFGYKAHGWEVFDFLTPAYIDGIAYIHYVPNPMSGKPYGGAALNILKNVGHSFLCGHTQKLDVAIRPVIGGKMQLGIVNGACYPFNEDYKGVTGNNHWRGATMLNEVKDGYGDPMFVSLQYMMDRTKY